MFTSTKALVAAMAENGALRAQVARLESHCDWLMAHVNELKRERADLFAQMLGFQLAGVPVIARQAAALEGADPAYVPTAADAKPGNIGDILAKAREIREAARAQGGAPESPLAAPGAELSFDDMGDDAAAKAGIRHASDGTLVYTR